ncbi:MAG: beta-eliminating lyase-related protein, partial [Xanthomonadales bacterium]|nr:beta-eliminating lyase-related protein [Xanthomonadales bacterium]
ICCANAGDAHAYGADKLTGRLDDAFSAWFEKSVFVLPLVSGTAGNSIALAQVCPPYGAVFCHEEAHIAVDECGAPEFYGGGLKLIPLPGENGKLTSGGLQERLGWFGIKGDHEPVAAGVSLTQATECGTVYRAEEIGELAAVARQAGMRVHLDGARFANALAFLEYTPAELTWRAGVDLMTLGATKNGAMAAEAVVVFDPDLVAGLSRRRMKGGHLLSKMRYVSAQLLAWLDEDRWLKLATAANAGAARLAGAIDASEHARLAYPTEANEVFAFLEPQLDEALRGAGFDYYPWPGHPGLFRLVVPWNVTEASLQRFEEVLAGSG